MTADFVAPVPINESVGSYAPGTIERQALQARLGQLASQEIEIPLLIGGKEIRTGRCKQSVMPHRHSHVLATWHLAGEEETGAAVAAAAAAWQDWSRRPFVERASVFLRAAELLSTTWRDTLNAATMLGQSKTVHEAEIDSACELIDFFRFNVHYAERLYAHQPLSTSGSWNRLEYRSLEGFVYAITPFNFTSIAGNLPAAPALMGNTVIWKPSTTATYSGYYIARLLEEAGLPPGVINFVPGDPVAVSKRALSDPSFAGVHFTGSTFVFQQLWRLMADWISTYKSYPRIVGETGGKDFIVAHASADPEALTTAIIRGGFEYQGQKCSAVSRVYLPDSVWKQMKDDLLSQVESIVMGDPTDFRNFMCAVIDEKAVKKIAGYLDDAKTTNDATLLAGGEVDAAEGYFIRPTIIQAKKPDYRTMCEEIFGPVVTLYVYRDREWAETLRLVDETSPYALTGAVFAGDRKAVVEAADVLRHAAGNFYINDKPTGAVVGQQPFGGSRASGTNDKAGSMMNLLRWVSARTIKETFVSPKDYRYPFMADETPKT